MLSRAFVLRTEHDGKELRIGQLNNTHLEMCIGTDRVVLNNKEWTEFQSLYYEIYLDSAEAEGANNGA